MNMTEILRVNENEIRLLRMQGMKMKDLAQKYNVSYSIMTHFLTTHNIILKESSIDLDIINEIVERYNNGERYDYIAKEFHFDKEKVRFILEKYGNGVKEKSDAFRIYNINKHFFDNINTDVKAYILGLLYTDGCRRKRENHYQIILKLQDRDVDILYKIKKAMNFERPLKFIDLSLQPRDFNQRNQYSLIIDNKQIALSLEKWGIIPNKTKTLKFPDFLSENLIPHFIRGCWDGDGTISHNLKEQRAGFIGTYDMCVKIKEHIENKLNVHFTIRKTESLSMDNLYTITIHGRIQLKKFLDYLYEDSNIHFDRKYSYYRYMCYGEELNNSLLE